MLLTDTELFVLMLIIIIDVNISDFLYISVVNQMNLYILLRLLDCCLESVHIFVVFFNKNCHKPVITDHFYTVIQYCTTRK
jgi:hypothetical protein